MKRTHLLEIKHSTPKQFRVTVLEDSVSAIMHYRLDSEDDDFVQVGFYDTAEECLDVLDRHLQLESSR